MKKKYEAPEFEVILLDLADVVRASNEAWTPGGEEEGTLFGSISKW